MATSEQTVSQFGIPHKQTAPDERARLTVTGYSDEAPQVVMELAIETAQVDTRGNRIWRDVGTAVVHRDIETDDLATTLQLNSYGRLDTETAISYANALIWAATVLEITRDWLILYTTGERYGP